MTLYGDTSLALEIHIIKHLGLEILSGDSIGVLKETIGKCALAVVDMGYYRKVSYMFFVQKTPRNGVRNKIRRNLV